MLHLAVRAAVQVAAALVRHKLFLHKKCPKIYLGHFLFEKKAAPSELAQPVGYFLVCFFDERGNIRAVCDDAHCPLSEETVHCHQIVNIAINRWNI